MSLKGKGKGKGNSGPGLENTSDTLRMEISAKPLANTSPKDLITSQISQLPSWRKYKPVKHFTLKREKGNKITAAASHDNQPFPSWSLTVRPKNDCHHCRMLSTVT